MHLQIPSGHFAGYLFDLDGTLVDTMPLHYRAWDAAIRHVGLTHPLDEDLFYSFGGIPSTRVAELIGQHYGLKLDPQAVMDDKEARFLKLLPEVRPIKAVVDFLDRVAVKFPRAIVTGGTPEVAIPCLEASGLRPYFDLVITPHDVPPGRGKPAPDMFLLAAQRIGIAPADCLVFEDAEPGIQAALAAGMKVVRVPSRPARSTVATS